MSSIKRNQLKLQYAKFARAWGNEKAYQKYVTETLGQELPADMPKLGRKPTFNMWKKAMEKQAKTFLKQKKEERAKAEESIPSLDWDEEESTQVVGEAAAVAEQAEVQGK